MEKMNKIYMVKYILYRFIISFYSLMWIRRICKTSTNIREVINVHSYIHNFFHHLVSTAYPSAMESLYKYRTLHIVTLELV